jgi:phospholipase D1/2
MSLPTDLSPDVDPTEVVVTSASNVDSGDKEVYPPTRGLSTPLIDGRAAYKEMYKRITEAKRYIYLSAWHLRAETVVFSDGEKSTIERLLKAAAKRGVEVRILVSYLLCAKLPLPGVTKPVGFCDARKATSVKSYFESLNKERIKAVVAYHSDEISYQDRTYHVGCFHEKFMIVDGQYGFCGGLEFTNGYTFSDPNHELPRSNRHDVHSLLEGPIVQQLETHFVQRWKEEKPNDYAELPAPTANYDATKTSMALQLAITKWDADQWDIRDIYEDGVLKAKRYIYIENQYFRDARFTNALIYQLNSEADLRIILVLPLKPEEASDPITDHAVFLQHNEIERLRAEAPNRVGVYSLMRTAKMDIYVHAKVMIIDDCWATIGSANINSRSFSLDGEVNVVIRDDAVPLALRLALWGEHFKIDDTNRPRAELGASTGFVDWWNELAAKRTADIAARGKSDSRVTIHTPLPGKEIDLGALGVPWYMRLILPDVDEFTGDFGPLTVG